jgi:predicted nucleotidyltransferase
MTMAELRQYREPISRIARRRGITSVRVFGSVARGEATDDSDVDLLVEVEPGRTILAVGGFLDEVSELLGRPVHVLTQRSLRGGLGSRALSEATPL